VTAGEGQVLVGGTGGGETRKTYRAQSKIIRDNLPALRGREPGGGGGGGERRGLRVHGGRAKRAVKLSNIDALDKVSSLLPQHLTSASSPSSASIISLCRVGSASNELSGGGVGASEMLSSLATLSMLPTSLSLGRGK
jgi:hypothetical protein